MSSITPNRRTASRRHPLKHAAPAEARGIRTNASRAVGPGVISTKGNGRGLIGDAMGGEDLHFDLAIVGKGEREGYCEGYCEGDRV